MRAGWPTRCASVRAKFAGGSVDFSGARFEDGTVDFSHGRFEDGNVEFGSAQFAGGIVRFDRATGRRPTGLPDGMADHLS
ncbi:pentapeptide repeat-containing protein [Actinomadura sp. 3N407]|uniref:pentapeptide repeat-containing protein n=1 Tax=Actinomadura sp. 3N407 TaxID=3457423 RepID=UPI003FCDD15C